MKTVAILGGGGTGCTMAADNVLRGNTVRLWEEEQYWHENLAAVEQKGGIEITGNAITGFAKLPALTKSMAESVEGAEVIMIAALTARHAAIVRELAPLLKRGQTVCISAGNCSSILLRSILGNATEVAVGEMSGNVYPCRIVDKAKVLVAFPYKPKGVSAFPARDTARLIEGLSGVYDCVPVTNVLEGTLNSPNIVVHLAGSLLNTCAIDRNPDFRLYTEGLSENVLKVVAAVEAEKEKLMAAMGYNCAKHTPFMRQVMQSGEFPELKLFRTLAGPSAMDHRYVTEDAAFGQSIFYSLAQTLGIDTPCTRSLIFLAGVVNNTDYFSSGISMESLGMGGMNAEQINAYLAAGKK